MSNSEDRKQRLLLSRSLAIENDELTGKLTEANQSEQSVADRARSRGTVNRASRS